MSSRSLLIACLCLVPLTAQGQAASPPTMSETAQWLHATLPTLSFSFYTLETYNGVQWRGATFGTSVRDVLLSNCVLEYESEHKMAVDGGVATRTRYRVPLRNIDVSSIRPVARTIPMAGLESTARYGGPVWSIDLRTLGGANVILAERINGDVPTMMSHNAGIPLQNEEGGLRVARALVHATRLCGGREDTF
jgi:hypothetical protein